VVFLAGREGPLHPERHGRGGRGRLCSRMTVVGADLPPSDRASGSVCRTAAVGAEGRTRARGAFSPCSASWSPLRLLDGRGNAGIGTGHPLGCRPNTSRHLRRWLGYGLAIIATARGRGFRLMLRDWGLGDSPAARCGWAWPTSFPRRIFRGGLDTPLRRPVLLATGELSADLLHRLFGPVAFRHLPDPRRVSSLRAVKQASSQPSPSFTVRAMGLVVDGEAWTTLADAAPRAPSLARTPLLWTGQDWFSATARPTHR